MKAAKCTYSGSLSPEVTSRERENRVIARQAAAAGFVLLKNEGVLPLKQGQMVSLWGGGAVKTIKGGTGSGDVNEREVVGIYQGLRNAGIPLSNRSWLDSFAATYRKAREDWRAEILADYEKSGRRSLIGSYSTHIFRMPAGDPITREALAGADTAFYVISRTAGEDADRFTQPGDYYLSDAEKEQLDFLSRHVQSLAVILNVGGPIDLNYIESLPNLKCLMMISQPGMEGGSAFADVVLGKVSPSGKLTDTWAREYTDIPNARTFSHLDGNIETELYEDGQYVGYRYFDSFDVKPAYPFGFGLSYTTFDIHFDRLEVRGNDLTASVTVANTGDAWSGREVVQLYASCPQTDIPKVHRRLIAFAKTKELAPGEHQTLTIPFTARYLAAFDEAASAWTVEQGRYGIWCGNSSRDLNLCAVLEAAGTVALEEVAHICPLKQELNELVCENRFAREAAWHALAEGLEPIPFAPVQETPARITPNALSQLAREITEKATLDQLIDMVCGEIAKGQGSQIGAAGIMVPGAAGETSSSLEAGFGIPGVSMADGPAGLRLVKSYEVDQTDGHIVNQGFAAALEGGFFADQSDHENCRRYYQYATAIPVGTLLAQTWDVEVLATVGRAVAREMQEFGISWWLAPSMNIHRNPLCGRNFEYYSEAPVLSGKMAAAITRGVQSVPGVGTTIKHFACNSQEENRMGADSVLTERTLREIYLRGFEIAVKEAQPMAIMTSYNVLNGVHTANSRDLCTVAARQEWDFQGIIMTDWCTTFPHGGSKPEDCIAAGNDLIMPGCQGDKDGIRAAIAEGRLSAADLKACVQRLLTVIFQTLAFEDAVPYGGQFR